MIDMLSLNPITAALIIIVAVPIITGAFMQFTREGVHRSLWSLCDSLMFLCGLFLSIYLTRKVFFEHPDGFFKQIYDLIPLNLQTMLYGQDVLIYMVFVPVLLLVFSSLMRLFHDTFNRLCLAPLADILYSCLASVGQFIRGIIGALTQVPRAAFILFLAGMALNFFVYYYPSPALSNWMNESGVYQKLYKEALCPVLNSNLAKNIPVIVNDSLARTIDRVIPFDNTPGNPVPPDSKKGIIIKYFNGVTLEEAVQSNQEIDETARALVGNEQNSTKKAYLIYRWIARNIKYDYDKASALSKGTDKISSGSIVAFNTRKGICFDYSCLYISMCRAVGLKVRLITGVAYSGTAWGDHAWNQVYSPEEGRWINVDTTFGSNGYYFDKPDFIADHRYPVVQGEW